MPTLFEDIIRSGDVTALEDHLKLTPKEKVSQIFKNGQSPIHVAIQSKYDAMTTLLLFRYKANPYSLDSQKHSPLHYAILVDNPSAMKKLKYFEPFSLEQDRNRNKPTLSQLVTFAAMNEKLNALDQLITWARKHSIEIGKSLAYNSNQALRAAINTGSLDRVINYCHYYEVRNKLTRGQNLALRLARKLNRSDIVEFLLNFEDVQRLDRVMSSPKYSKAIFPVDKRFIVQMVLIPNLISIFHQEM